MTASDNTPQLLLLSGMAADADVFFAQRIAFPDLVVPEWPIPNRGESMPEYCQRFAEILQHSEPVIIGGASFGGIVAQELAKHLQPRAVLLIGSIRGPDELPWFARYSRPLRFIVPLIPIRFLQLLAWPITTKFARPIMPHLSGMARQFYRSNPRLFTWSLRRLLEWESAPEVDCSVFQVHGERDWLLPRQLTSPDRVIQGAGHAISMTHPREVNEFIRNVIADSAGQPPRT